MTTSAGEVVRREWKIRNSNCFITDLFQSYLGDDEQWEKLVSDPYFETRELIVKPAEPAGTVVAFAEESKAFEEWAQGPHVGTFDMQQHPLHYLFLDPKTNAARAGWKSAIAWMNARTAPAAPVVPAEVMEAAERMERPGEMVSCVDTEMVYLFLKSLAGGNNG